jgi:methylated-DNA-[protein]-cysteine S-methyltransferase
LVLSVYTSILDTPIGILVIEGNDKDICFIGFKDDIRTESPNLITEKAKLQLREYFEGKRSLFDLPAAQPGTDFQQSVWKELTNIPPGKPISYTSLSDKMNNPLAIRAIASANGKNKLMIVIPCHRVIGSNGDLVGYAGGLWRKKWLLEHEAKMTGIGQTVLSL